jgi:hypothetical protein
MHYSGKPFRAALPDLGLTSNQVWGLTKTDEEWSAALEAALTATRRNDLEHGTNAAYVASCVCNNCREHQRQRIARNKGQAKQSGTPGAEVSTRGLLPATYSPVSNASLLVIPVRERSIH